jgi:putative ABC transport system substrate-binding protein
LCGNRRNAQAVFRSWDARPAAAETQSIPIVFVVVVDPMGSGFVESFARPGRNVTGFQNYEFSMVGKWVQTLQEMVPELRRIAYIYNPSTAPLGFVRALENIAPSMSVQLIPTPIRNATEIDTSLTELAQQPQSGFMMFLTSG